MNAGPVSAYLVREEPYYRPIGAEVELFAAAYAARLPVMLKGPTGCGKTRFVEHMAWRLGRPLLTVACNEELSASDLLGRYLLEEGATRWHDGPLTLAVRHGAICYLDEVVEARQDTLVAIHPVTDHRRILSIPAHSEVVQAHPDFHLVVSHNPGYQSAFKDLKPSTKQRFGAIAFGYPERVREVEIVVHETALAEPMVERLVSIAEAARRLKGHGLEEGVSTRMLVHAGQLIARGVQPVEACEMALLQPLSDDSEVLLTLRAVARATLGAV